MKHQFDATLCRFYFCRVTLHVSGTSAHHQDYLKPVRQPLVHVLSLQVSHHILNYNLVNSKALVSEYLKCRKFTELKCTNNSNVYIYIVGQGSFVSSVSPMVFMWQESQQKFQQMCGEREQVAVLQRRVDSLKMEDHPCYM